MQNTCKARELNLGYIKPFFQISYILFIYIFYVMYTGIWSACADRRGQQILWDYS